MKALIRLFVALTAITILFGTANAQEGSVTARIEVDRSVQPSENPSKAVVKLTLVPAAAPRDAKRPPINLAVVLDRSSSMNGDKIVRAREAAIEILQRLDAQDYFSLVTYSSGVETLVPAQQVTDIGPIIEKIRGITPGGTTALFAGVSQGANEVRKHLGDEMVSRVILLSDGQANVGPRSPEELGRLGAALIKEGISVTTVGVGLNYNEDLMTQISQKSDGGAYFAKTADDLPAIFNRELGDVLNVVASSVKIEINFAAGVKPMRIIGLEGSVEGSSVQLQFNQLYGSREKTALVEVEVAPQPAGTAQEAAVVQVTYKDMLADRPAIATGQLSLAYSSDMAAVEASRNAAVQAEYALLNSAVAQDVTIALYEQGKQGAAVENLRFNSQQLRQLGNEIKNEALLKQADTLDQQAAQLEAQGLSQEQRKAMRHQSYDLRNAYEVPAQGEANQSTQEAGTR